MGVMMLDVTPAARLLRKLRSVTTRATPFGHSDCVLISGGGTRPAANDICHFRSKGNQILAAAIAERVLELVGAVPEPMVAPQRSRDGDRPPRRKRREKPPADVVDPPSDG